jgi:hypothetical protein
MNYLPPLTNKNGTSLEGNGKRDVKLWRRTRPKSQHPTRQGLTHAHRQVTGNMLAHAASKEAIQGRASVQTPQPMTRKHWQHSKCRLYNKVVSSRNDATKLRHMCMGREIRANQIPRPRSRQVLQQLRDPGEGRGPEAGKRDCSRHPAVTRLERPCELFHTFSLPKDGRAEPAITQLPQKHDPGRQP